MININRIRERFLQGIYNPLPYKIASKATVGKLKTQNFYTKIINFMRQDAERLLDSFIFFRFIYTEIDAKDFKKICQHLSDMPTKDIKLLHRYGIINDGEFNKFGKLFYHNPVSFLGKLQGVRSVSNNEFENAKEIRDLMGKYKENIFFHPVIDIIEDNGKLKSVVANHITIQNLYIKGGVNVNINNFLFLNFINNMSYNRFRINLNNCSFVKFENNVLKRYTNINCLAHHYNNIMIIKFVGNFINRLNIQDNLPLSNCMKKPFVNMIDFKGRNIIQSLYLDTQCNKLNHELDKVDKKHISFDLKDMIIPIYTSLKEDQIREKLIAYKNYFLKLQKTAHDEKDRWSEKNYERKVRYYDRRLATRLQDKIIFWWSVWLSNSGISWIHPIIALLYFQVIFIALAFSLGEYNHLSFLRIYGESLIPISNLSTLMHGEGNDAPGWLSVINIAQKIVLATCVYESVKALRRFSP